MAKPASHGNAVSAGGLTFREVPLLEMKGQLVAVDTECTGLQPWGSEERWGYAPARPFAFSFATEKMECAYIRWKVDPMTRRVIPREKDVQAMRAVLGDPRRTKILHNGRYDLRMLALSGIKTAGVVHDTLVLAHVVTGGSELTYGLKPLCARHLEIDDDDQRALKTSVDAGRRTGRKQGWCLATSEKFGRDATQADYWVADRELCKRYALTDAIRTQALFQVLWETLREDSSLEEIYRIEMRVFWALWRMENRGVRVFPERLEELRAEFTEAKKRQREEFERQGCKDLNPRSPKQLCHQFYTVRRLPERRTPKGNLKCDKAVLWELVQSGDRLARALYEYRVADHALRNFVAVYDRLRVEEHGVWVLHGSFRQSGAVTGRMSCSDPNLMTVQSETTSRALGDIHPRPRYAFGPRPGYLWLLPDYSQMEVWVFAYLSGDQAMLETLQSGRDFHGEIARRIWGHNEDWEERKDYYRKRGKLVMFCKLYGGGVGKVAQIAECSGAEAQQLVAEWEAALPGAVKFMNDMQARVRRDRQVRNAFGRLYLFHDPNEAYRSVNYLVQGTCADILKRSLVRLDRLFREQGSRWKGCCPLIPIHDEIVMEIPLEKHCPILGAEIVQAMQADYRVLGWPQALPVEIKVARESWHDAQKWDAWKEAY